MNIDWSHFTPYTALAGGAMIGLAAALLIVLNGRIAGISGILSGLLRWPADEGVWRIAFVAGLLLAPAAWQVFAALPGATIEASSASMVAAGLLVGVGTRIGSGCTSGHGVCGLARFSRRSLVATLSFMAAAIVTVYLLRHVWRAV